MIEVGADEGDGWEVGRVDGDLQGGAGFAALGEGEGVGFVLDDGEAGEDGFAVLAASFVRLGANVPGLGLLWLDPSPAFFFTSLSCFWSGFAGLPSLALTSSGPFAPAPKPSVIRS